MKRKLLPQIEMPFGMRPFSDNDTSLKSAIIGIKNSGTQCRTIVDHLLLTGGSTDHEIVEGTGLLLSSINGARSLLMRDGIVVRTSERRMSKCNRPNAVWAINPRLIVDA